MEGGEGSRWGLWPAGSTCATGSPHPQPPLLAAFPLGHVWHHQKLRFHHHASNAEEVLPSLCLAHPSGIHDCLLGAVHRGFLPFLYEVHHHHQRQVGWHRQLRQSFLPTRRFCFSLRFHCPRGHCLRDHRQCLRLPPGVDADPQTSRYQFFSAQSSSCRTSSAASCWVIPGRP